MRFLKTLVTGFHYTSDELINPSPIKHYFKDALGHTSTIESCLNVNNNTSINKIKEKIENIYLRELAVTRHGLHCANEIICIHL